jgi:hypothetical protein
LVAFTIGAIQRRTGTFIIKQGDPQYQPPKNKGRRGRKKIIMLSNSV